MVTLNEEIKTINFGSIIYDMEKIIFTSGYKTDWNIDNIWKLYISVHIHEFYIPCFLVFF